MRLNAKSRLFAIRRNSMHELGIVVHISKTLEELALKVSKTVIKTNKSITLEPMNAYERKILHTELQDSEFVKTYSVGEGDRRRVVIAKK